MITHSLLNEYLYYLPYAASSLQYLYVLWKKRRNKSSNLATIFLLCNGHLCISTRERAFDNNLICFGDLLCKKYNFSYRSGVQLDNVVHPQVNNMQFKGCIFKGYLCDIGLRVASHESQVSSPAHVSKSQYRGKVPAFEPRVTIKYMVTCHSSCILINFMQQYSHDLC